MKKFFKNLMPMLLLVAGLGIAPNLWALDANNATIYFNNTNAKWNYVQLLIGHNNSGGAYSTGVALSHINNTQLWVLSDYSWGGYGYYMFVEASGSWGGTSQQPWDRKGSNTYTKTCNTNLGSDTYIHTPKGTGNEPEWNVDKLSGGYSDLNKTQTVYVYVKYKGQSTDTKVTSNWPGTIKPDAYYLSNASTATHNTTALTPGDGVQVKAVLTSKFTLTATAKSGYTWTGWTRNDSYAVPDNGNVYTNNPVDGEYTLYAHFEENAYYMKYNWDGSNWSWNLLTDNGDGTYSCEGTFRGGYTTNWHFLSASASDESNKTTATSSYTLNSGDKCIFTLNPTANSGKGTITITPKSYTLTLDNNGGTITSGQSTQTVTVMYGQSTITGSWEVPTKTGYKYGGYYKEGTTSNPVILSTSQVFSTAATNPYAPSGKWNQDGDRKVYAKWTANTYYVKFNANGGWGDEMTKQQHTYDQSLALSKNTYTRIGYNFIGWNTDKNATIALYEDEEEVSNLTTGTTQVELFAIWEPYETTVTVNANGGKEEDQEFTAKYEQVVDASSITPNTRDGYTLVEYDNEEGNKILGADLSPRSTALSGWIIGTSGKWGNLNSTATIYAKWKANDYTITLHYNDGTENTGTKTVTFDATAGSVEKPTYGDNVFNGYFTQATDGVQVINADGAFLTNVTGYTSNGNWVKASDVDLYAQWTTRTACTITYGVTDGTQAVSTRGTIRAKIGEDSYTNTGSLDVYTGDLVTITYTPKTGQHFSVNGYEAKGWYDAVSGGSSLPATHKNDYTFTVTGDASVYVKADPILYTISTLVNPAPTTIYPTGAGTITPTSGEAGPDIALQLVAQEKTGYDWANWTLSDENNGKIVAGTAMDKTISVAAKAAGFTATANFSAHNYTITYNLDGGTNYDGAPATYTIETATINLGTPTKTDYTFDGWFDAETEGNKVTEITLGSFGDKTLWARWHETTYLISTSEGTGIQSIDPTSQLVGNVTEKTFTATVKTGYTWTNWTLPAGVTGTATNNPISIKATAEGTITANATENLSTITISSNNTDYGTVNVNNASVGVTTTQQLVATNEYGYKFKEWDLQGGVVLATGAKTDATIIIKGDGNSTAGTAQAIFEEDLSTPWRLNIGVDGQSGWQQPAFVKRTGESTNKVAYVSVVLTGGTVYHFNYVTGESTYKGSENDHAEMPANTEWTFNGSQRAKFIAGVSGTYTFKIDYTNNDPKASYETPSTSGIKGDWTGWAHEDGIVIDNVLTYQHTFGAGDITSQAFKVVFNGVFYGAKDAVNNMTRQDCSDWTLTSTDGGKNINLNVDMAGQYTFTYNSTTNKLSVTYPGETMTSVTVYLDGETASTVEVGEATHPTIEAVQYVNGKRFAGWQADEGVTLANANDRTTQITAVTGAGKSVRATYNTNYMVYFKNTPGWGDVHVFFYTVDAHWKDNGTGIKYKKDDGTWVQIATGHHMTRLNDKSDIWYYDYSGVSDVHGAIAFNDHNQYDYEYFANCQAAYRTDWDRGHNLSVFVPEKNISEKKNNNSAAYYNKGYWMKYDDLKTGYYLRVDGKSGDYEFAAASNGEPYKATITLEGSQTKEFWINGVNGSNYKNAGTMTSSGSHSGWEFYEGNQANCKITTTSEGTYTFTLTFGEGMLLVSVEYPLSENDYRVVYTDNNHLKGHPSTFIRKGDGNKDIVSFFIDTEKSPALKFQYCSAISGSTVTWTDVEGGTIDISSIAETGIYNFNLEQNASSISCTGHGLYDGDFYIRTAIAPGGWDAYLGTDGNTLPYIEYGLDDSQPFKFTHAYTNWVEKDKNVKFCIANDYSLCISDTLVGDDILGEEDNADWLKNGANIRFMWNKNTNALSRAYISGSTNDEERFLMLVGDEKMFDDKGVALLNNELKFTDKNNWVYQADIQAQPGCAVKLTAQYTIGTTAHEQYFIGSKTESKEIISGTGDKKYKMRAVYDFKTNRLTAGWIPDDGTIDTDIKLGGDMLLVREHQRDANQITFSGSGKVSDIHHIYGVLTLQKDVMAGTAKMEYTDKATNANYEKTMYWISFPFDVNISEIFGVDGYGKKWIMQKYRGDLRAQKGWFAETSTFWEYMDISEKLNAYEGYLFIVDANYFNTLDADVWKNSATEANFYFPSAEKNIGIINESSVTITVPEHECKINRTFGDNMNHMFTDSHWNVIGVPTFQNSTASTIDGTDNDFKSYYEWDHSTNGYNVQAALDNTITFNTMKAYMVQYAGTITWQNVSVVAKKAPYAYADEKNYMIELFFNGNGAEDHTYINLADEASTDFVLNEDMMKIDNAGQPNIYSFAGAYNVAYNETTFDNQSVMLGVSAPKDGTYTFAMPKDFSGKAVLVDLESGEATDLNLSNYTVELNKGTYNNRFQLLLEVEAKAPTNMNPTKGEWSVDGKTKKLFINDNIYLINAGRIYNASGTQVK